MIRRVATVALLALTAAGPVSARAGVVDQDGRPFSFAALRGNEVVSFFGYTHCPDVCPTVLATLALVRRRLATNARLKVVFVTVDPARDDTARVKRFVDVFDPRFIGVTGPANALEPIYRTFKIWSAKIPNPDGAGYLAAHESGIVFLDASGAVRDTLPWNSATAVIERDVRTYLP
jgi:protein SCO1/2